MGSIKQESGGTVTEQDRMVAGRYRLNEQVGIGAMGIVWRAMDERLHRTVAVKQLLLQPGLDQAQADEARLRAMREGRIAARLHHPNVVIVYDVVDDDGQPWLIMEYVPSRSLGAVLRDGAMSPYSVAAIGAQAAAGLAAAHAVGIVHRDVKPGNVLLGEDGMVKIADFGISRAVDDVVLTATGLLTGTPAYLAPEMAKGEVPAPPADVFALGATLYAAVEGTPPFGLSDNPLALLHLVAEGRVRPPSQAGPLTAVLMSLLRRDAADRPTMREAHDVLAAVAAERTMPVRLSAVAAAAPRALTGARPGGGPARPGSGQRQRWESGPGARPDGGSGARPEGGQRQRPERGPGARPDGPGRALQRTQIGVPALSSTAPARPRRRWSTKLVLVIAAAVLAVSAAVVLIDRAGQGGTGSAAGKLPAPTTAQAGPPTFAAMSGLITRFYGLLPGDVHDAYELLSANYRFMHPLPSVQGFYATIAQVSPGHFQPVGPNTVRAVITFVTKRGTTSHEPYRFTVVRRRGVLIIDNAVPITSTDGT
jgi:hypothetical protein